MPLLPWGANKDQSNENESVHLAHINMESKKRHGSIR